MKCPHSIGTGADHVHECVYTGDHSEEGPHNCKCGFEWDTPAMLVELQKLLNTPEIQDFMKAVPLEALHQRQRWGETHDENKTPQDWFWVVGYLAGKLLRAHIDGDFPKAKHHSITVAALMNNYHAMLLKQEEENGR